MPTDIDVLLSGNLLLSALRLPDQALIKPHLELKAYARGEALFEVGEDVGFISFPLDQCVAALVIGLQDGRAVETDAQVSLNSASARCAGWLSASAPPPMRRKPRQARMPPSASKRSRR